jgi:hypothetical protein
MCEERFQLRVIAHVALEQIGCAEFSEQRTHMCFGGWAPIGQHKFRASPVECQGGAISDTIVVCHTQHQTLFTAQQVGQLSGCRGIIHFWDSRLEGTSHGFSKCVNKF